MTKHHKKLWLASLFIMIFSACLLWGCTDDNSDEAEDVRLENALNNRDYDYIIGRLSYMSYENSTDSNNWTFSVKPDLTYRRLYLLQMACIGKSGFDIKNIIKELYEDGADSVAIIMQSLNSGEPLTPANIKALRFWIGKNKYIADNYAQGNKDMEFAAGWASTLDVILMTAQISAEFSSDPVSFDKNDSNYIGNIFAGLSDAEIDNKVSPLVTDFADNVQRIEETVDSLDVVSGADKGKIKDKLDDFMASIKNPAGQVDTGSVREFIKDKIVDTGN